MYGYAARYAPSTVIEARINALVVWYPIQTNLSPLFQFNPPSPNLAFSSATSITLLAVYLFYIIFMLTTIYTLIKSPQCLHIWSMEYSETVYYILAWWIWFSWIQGTNMLGRFLHVQHPTAKQAVITAIDLLGDSLHNMHKSYLCFTICFSAGKYMGHGFTFESIDTYLCCSCFVMSDLLLFSYCSGLGSLHSVYFFLKHTGELHIIILIRNNGKGTIQDTPTHTIVFSFCILLF